MQTAKDLHRELEREPAVKKQPREAGPEQRALHSLTHMPKADWCDACVSCRSREDNHGEAQGDEPRQRLVFCLDYMFMSEENLDDKTLTCLVCAESQFGSILAIPCAQKGSKGLKYCVEEVVRHSMLFQDQRTRFQVRQ